MAALKQRSRRCVRRVDEQLTRRPVFDQDTVRQYGDAIRVGQREIDVVRRDQQPATLVRERRERLA